jgi:hypothetical protein
MYGDIEARTAAAFQAKTNNAALQKGVCCVDWELHFKTDLESFDVGEEDTINMLQPLVDLGKWNSRADFDFSGLEGFAHLSGAH